MAMIEEDALSQEIEELSKTEAYNELIMLGMRRAAGIDEKTIRSLGDEIWKSHTDRAQQLIQEGTLSRQDDRLLLDKSLWYLSDHISSSLFL